jgi:hypothetical protein
MHFKPDRPLPGSVLLSVASAKKTVPASVRALTRNENMEIRRQRDQVYFYGRGINAVQLEEQNRFSLSGCRMRVRRIRDYAYCTIFVQEGAVSKPPISYPVNWTVK